MLEGKVDLSDINIIKKIPLHFQARGDELIWHYNCHGSNLVKLSYHVPV